jgi:hypothetical protein
MSKYTTSTTGNWGESEECQYQKHILQVVYIKAYIEITRLLAQYEVVIHTHTCEDYVWETEGQTEKLLEGKMVKMTTTVSSYTHKLEQYQVRIKAAIKLEVSIRSHITLLTTKCGEMDATISSLDKVRDAIHVLGVCPGLGRLTFTLPQFTGQMLDGDFDTTAMTDASVDEKMNALCAANPPNSLLQTQTSPGPVEVIYHYRAAETSEIMLRSIEGIPLRNTAAVPLLGTCPNCAGLDDEPDADVVHLSGHFRVCWDPEAALNAIQKRKDCSSGKKAVMCVKEQTYVPAR